MKELTIDKPLMRMIERERDKMREDKTNHHQDEKVDVSADATKI